MKQILILSVCYLLLLNSVSANEPPKFRDIQPPHLSNQERMQKESEFEKRLGLTEIQKQQAKNLRRQGFEEIKPVIDKIRQI